MAKFNKGDQIQNVNTLEKGVVIEVCKPQRGRQLYNIKYNDFYKDELESNIIPCYDMDNPFECCKQNIYGSHDDYSLLNTTFKIFNSNNNTISSLAASKTIFKAYQFIPLLKFLNSDNKRILIADEVGLGKTIEAGHILLEQKARGELRNALIICPKSLQEKWKDELYNKFGISFTIYEDKNSLIQNLKDSSVKGIINYEKIRRQKNSSVKSPKTDLISYIENSDKRFDIIICDEAHRLRNRNTQSYKGAEVIVQHSNAVVLLTATPIMISTENLYNLLHLMDSDRYNDSQNFDNILSSNRPFLHALSSVNNNVPLKEIADTLRKKEVKTSRKIDERCYETSKTVDELYSSVQLYNKIINNCQNCEDTPAVRAQLQYDISTMSPMNNIFSRTRKRDITTDWSQAERRPHTHRVSLYEHERELFQKVIDEYIDDNSYIDWNDDVRMDPGKALGLVQKKRRIASSVYGFMNESYNLDKGIDCFKEKPDAKFDKLVEIIEETFSNGENKIIVFALFKNTIKYLALRLKSKGYDCLSLHGDIKERDTILSEFRDNPKIRVLLSSEVGSEGLDMQFCSSMVNYDLPWNPMVVEQRIGRIDRFGQKSPIVNISNIIVRNSIQEEIYARLLDRIGIFRNSIGDLESILDRDLEKEGYQYSNINQMLEATEREFYCKKLSEEEMKKKGEQIERAIENENENLKNIEKELTNTLTNDIYFRNEISRIKSNNSYITETEMYNYVNALIKHKLTFCTLKSLGEEIYEFNIPLNNPKLLLRFLDEYIPIDEENKRILSEFKKTIYDETSLKITFEQEKAYHHKDLIYINMYNPIILAASNYFKNVLGNTIKKTFSFQINRNNVKLPIGMYYMAVYIIKTQRSIYGKNQCTEKLLPLVYSINDESIIDNNEYADNLIGASQIAAEPINNMAYDVSSDSIDSMRDLLSEKIDCIETEMRNDLKMRMDAVQMQLIQRTEEEYETRIQSLQESKNRFENEILNCTDLKRKNELSNIIRLMESNIKDHEIKRDEEIGKHKRVSDISIHSNLLSINYIKIY